MKYIIVLQIAATSLVLILSSCSETKEFLGINRKRAPDEFTVYTRAPLRLPPDYGLRPPVLNTTSGGESKAPHDKVRNVLITSSGRTAPHKKESYSNGFDTPTTAFLKRIGALNPDPGIRESIDRETNLRIKEDSRFVDSLLFWRDPEPFGTVIDPAKESRRIQENQALGKDITTDDPPVIKRKRKGWLEDIF